MIGEQEGEAAGPPPQFVRSESCPSGNDVGSSFDIVVCGGGFSCVHHILTTTLLVSEPSDILCDPTHSLVAVTCIWVPMKSCSCVA